MDCNCTNSASGTGPNTLCLATRGTNFLFFEFLFLFSFFTLPNSVHRPVRASGLGPKPLGDSPHVPVIVLCILLLFVLFFLDESVHYNN